MSRLFCILLLSSITSVSYANETGYEVELIIFADNSARYLHSEDWNYNDMLNNKKDEITKKVKTDPQYKKLDWENAKLAANLKRLESNSNFRILETRRWKQTGLDREHAFNISIGEEVQKDNETDADTQTSTGAEIDQPTEQLAEFETPSDAPVSPYLTGNVKLIMSRYLHFNVNLQYIRPQRDAEGELIQQAYPVVNERRMRSREIHYIDHPLVGIVVLATPFKITSQEQSTKPAEYKTM